MKSRAALGRGLSALFPDLERDTVIKNTPIICGIEELTPNPFQSRKTFRKNEIRELADSIRKNGIIQPIVVRKREKGYEIIAGERRWRAAQEVGLKEVPVIIREATDSEVAVLSLVENLQREALNPIEEAEALLQLHRVFGLSHEEIAQIVGKDRSTVANTLRLVKLPEDVKSILLEGKITSGHARTILSLEDPNDQINLAHMIVERSLSVRECERLIHVWKKKREKTSKKKDPYDDNLEKRLSEHLKTRVKVVRKKRGGCIEILYSSEEDLMRLADILLFPETKKK
ncbi:MAG: ParB/RepB/Spo0J family partition protein [Syntrophales bacterium]|nr:ParB/RepB/Spo0J family partition protein [Syntrophales bacterium]